MKARDSSREKKGKKKEKEKTQQRSGVVKDSIKKKYTVSLIKRKIQRSLGGPQDHF